MEGKLQLNSATKLIFILIEEENGSRPSSLSTIAAVNHGLRPSLISFCTTVSVAGDFDFMGPSLFLYSLAVFTKQTSAHLAGCLPISSGLPAHRSSSQPLSSISPTCPSPSHHHAYALVTSVSSSASPPPPPPPPPQRLFLFCRSCTWFSRDGLHDRLLFSPLLFLQSLRAGVPLTTKAGIPMDPRNSQNGGLFSSLPPWPQLQTHPWSLLSFHLNHHPQPALAFPCGLHGLVLPLKYLYCWTILRKPPGTFWVYFPST